jgi:alkylated DNA repair protein alkB family protein 6
MDFAAMMREERANMKAEAARKAKKQDPILSPRVAMDLGPHEVGDFGGAPCCWYIADWLTKGEETKLVQAIYGFGGAWSQLTQRRLQNWGGIPHPSGMIAERLPEFLDELSTRLVQCGVLTEEQRPNHCLLNEYTSGQGIDHHNDGSMYDSLVVILSLEGPAVLEFKHMQHRQADSLNSLADDSLPSAQSVLLQPRSLLVFSKNAYTDYTHGIAGAPVDVIVADAADAAHAAGATAARHAGFDSGAAVCSHCINTSAAGIESPLEASAPTPTDVTAAASTPSKAIKTAPPAADPAAPPAAPPPFSPDNADADAALTAGTADNADTADADCNITPTTLSSSTTAGAPKVTVIPRSVRRVSLTLRRVLSVVGGGGDFTPSGRDEAKRRGEWFMRSISERQQERASPSA